MLETRHSILERFLKIILIFYYLKYQFLEVGVPRRNLNIYLKPQEFKFDVLTAFRLVTNIGILSGVALCVLVQAYVRYGGKPVNFYDIALRHNFEDG